MTALQKIQIEAKKIRKAKPSIAYKDAIKQASKHYNAGKLGAAKKATPTKKSSPRLPVKKIVTTVTKEKVGSVGKSALDKMTKLINEILEEEKSIALLKAQAKTHPDKRLFIRSHIEQRKKYIAALKIQKNALKKFL